MGPAPRRVSAALLVVAALFAAAPAGAQQAFPTPEAAVDALVRSLSPVDEKGLSAVLGPSYRQLRGRRATASSATDRAPGSC
jgi:hypothetical protein